MNRLCTYSMVRTFYDRGQDYIDSFWPFVVCSFADPQRSLSYEELQRVVQDKTTLLIPLHPLKTIAQRAKRKGYLVCDRNVCGLTDSGREYRSKMEHETDAQRRINECLDSLGKFLNDTCEVALDRQAVEALLAGFIQKNIEYFLQFIIPAARAIGEERGRAEAKDAAEMGLVRFLLEADEKRPAVFDTLKDIICGSIISFLLQTESLPEVGRRIEKTQVFLDTNIAFSILGLHFREYNMPAQELFELVKREKAFRVSVFDFTVQEMVRVLSRYPSLEHAYFPDVRVDSIYSSLRSYGWTASRVREFIVRIEDELAKRDISVIRTGVNLDSYELEQAASERLHVYKPGQHPWNQGHDIEVISKVRQLRRGDVRRVEEARCLFLTADTGLARYNFNESGHRAAATVSEVIPDRLLANLLWLKNPRLLADMPLKTIIAVHSRDMFVDRHLWQSFHDTVTGLRNDGRIGDEDVAVLLFDQQLAGCLQNERSAETVAQPAWVLSRLADAKNRMDEQQRAAVSAAVERERSDIDGRLSQAEQTAARAVEERFVERVCEAKRQIQSRADVLSRRIVRTTAVASCLAIGGSVFFVGPWVAGHWGVLEPWTWVIGIAFGLIALVLAAVGWWFDFKALRSMFETWLSTRIFLSRVRQSHLENLVSGGGPTPRDAL